MIEEAYARQQIRRLSGLSFFPTDPIAVKEMVVALRDVANDEAAARTTIDGMLAACTECPKPAEIRRAVHASVTAAAKDYTVPGPTRCECGDSGFKRKVVERGGQKYDFAVPCECRISKPVDRRSIQ